MAETLCHGEDPELWFPTTERGRRKAIAICKRCPMQESCLAHALDHKIAHGVWGGLTPTERDRLTPAPGTPGALPGTTYPPRPPARPQIAQATAAPPLLTRSSAPSASARSRTPPPTTPTARTASASSPPTAAWWWHPE